VTRPLIPAALALAIVVGSACGGDAPGAGGLRTAFDSTVADTVVARTAGAVPATLVRSLTEELRIAPTADDTTLFGETFEFDVARDGRIYVYDQPGNAIFVFDAAGALVRKIGRQGSGPGEFSQNGGMTILRDGRLVQWDSRNARVNFFTADGDFQHQWSVLAGFSTLNGLRTDTSGAVLWYRPVTEPREGEILGRFGLVRLRDGGAIGDSLVPPDLPVELVTYIARQMDGGRVVGTSSMGPLHSPSFLWGWHPDGHFVSIASSTYRIEVSRPDRALRIVRDAPVIPIPEDERAWDQERITFQMKGNVPTWTWTGPDIPSEKPPVAGLSIARDGRIWVRVSTPSEPIPEAERDEQLPNRRPVSRFREGIEYEVFEKDGTFVGRIRFPRRVQWMEADGDTVWYLQRDEDGLPAVVRARITPGLAGESMD
jgi:hypothetical protein